MCVMRDVVATATGTAELPIKQCYVMLRDVERYPDWYPDGAKRVTVLQRDDEQRATEVDAVLAAVAGPLRKNFDVRLLLELEEPSSIRLVRVADGRGDHEALTIAWTLRSLSESSTEISVEMSAHLELPPFLPIDPIAREAANGFLQAALAALAVSASES
jgi:ribosome-associated toxin RatA of RatAB toxin-antitoxin module